MRYPWSHAELAALRYGLSWRQFHERWPDRSYDSWEVKRRRVVHGSAGAKTHVLSKFCWCGKATVHVGARG